MWRQSSQGVSLARLPTVQAMLRGPQPPGFSRRLCWKKLEVRVRRARCRIRWRHCHDQSDPQSQFAAIRRCLKRRLYPLRYLHSSAVRHGRYEPDAKDSTIIKCCARLDVIRIAPHHGWKSSGEDRVVRWRVHHRPVAVCLPRIHLLCASIFVQTAPSSTLNPGFA